MQNKNILIVFFACIVIIYFCRDKEHMTNNEITSEQQNIIDKIYEEIITNKYLTLEEYLDFLITIGNTNLNIIDHEVFVTFKMLQKRDMLTKNDIIQAMKL